MIFTTTIRTDQLKAYDTESISVYTYTKNGNNNEFTGSGETGRAYITQQINNTDTFTVNGNPVTAYIGNISSTLSNIGQKWIDKWVLFIYDGDTINFKENNGNNNQYVIGNGLKLDIETNTVSVNTTDTVSQNNTLPITSAAVYTTVGNIQQILKTI